MLIIHKLYWVDFMRFRGVPMKRDVLDVGVSKSIHTANLTFDI